MDAGRPAPEVYRLSMEKLPLAVARARRLAFLQLALATTALVAAVTPFTSSHLSAIEVGLAVELGALVAAPYVLWRVGRRLRRHWNAFELAIGADVIRLAAKGEGRVTIRRDEVAQVAEGATGLLVRSAEPGVVVHVPFTVEGYVDVRARLGALRPITARADARGWCLGVLGAGVVGVAAAPLFPRAPGVGIGLLVCQLALAVFAAFEIARHPALSRAERLGAIALIAAGGIAPVLGLLRV
jgi:hypothetical protein